MSCRLIAAAKSSEARRCPCQSVRATRRPFDAGRLLKRRVEILANQSRRRRCAAAADPIGLDDDHFDAGRGKSSTRTRIR